eukprot:g2983.t1
MPLSDYSIVGKRAVGKGKFSLVYRAVRLCDEKLVALKKVNNFMKLKEKDKESCLKEVKLLQSLDHVNIIKYLDSFVADNSNTLIIVTDWAEAGDLKRQLRKLQAMGAHLREHVIWRYFSQIAEALKHIHDHRILHRDLKPANIFLTSDAVIKVGDFGLSRKLGENTLQAHSKVGTPYYASPELLGGKGYDWRTDVWSLGCILYELACLKSPFKQKGLNLYKLFQKISKGKFDPVPPRYSDSLRLLVDRMVNVDVSERPSMSEVCEVSQKMRKKTMKARAERKRREREAAAAAAAASSKAVQDAVSSHSESRRKMKKKKPVNSGKEDKPLIRRKRMSVEAAVDSEIPEEINTENGGREKERRRRGDRSSMVSAIPEEIEIRERRRHQEKRAGRRGGEATSSMLVKQSKHDFNVCIDPKADMAIVLEDINNSDWTLQFPATEKLRSICIYHPELLQSCHMKHICTSLCVACANLRSAPARNALYCLGDLFSSIISYRSIYEEIASTELLNQCVESIFKCAGSNKQFLRDAAAVAINALVSVVDAMSDEVDGMGPVPQYVDLRLLSSEKKELTDNDEEEEKDFDGTETERIALIVLSTSVHRNPRTADAMSDCYRRIIQLTGSSVVHWNIRRHWAGVERLFSSSSATARDLTFQSVQLLRKHFHVDDLVAEFQYGGASLSDAERLVYGRSRPRNEAVQSTNTRQKLSLREALEERREKKKLRKKQHHLQSNSDNFHASRENSSHEDVDVLFPDHSRKGKFALSPSVRQAAKGAAFRSFEDSINGIGTCNISDLHGPVVSPKSRRLARHKDQSKTLNWRMQRWIQDHSEFSSSEIGKNQVKQNAEYDELQFDENKAFQNSTKYQFERKSSNEFEMSKTMPHQRKTFIDSRKDRPKSATRTKLPPLKNTRPSTEPPLSFPEKGVDPANLWGKSGKKNVKNLLQKIPTFNRPSLGELETKQEYDNKLRSEADEILDAMEKKISLS